MAGFKSPEERALLYLKPGDVIEAEIERIGVLRNPVVGWQEAHGEPAPPRIRPGATREPVLVGSVELVPLIDAVGLLGELDGAVSGL